MAEAFERLMWMTINVLDPPVGAAAGNPHRGEQTKPEPT